MKIMPIRYVRKQKKKKKIIEIEKICIGKVPKYNKISIAIKIVFTTRDRSE